LNFNTSRDSDAMSKQKTDYEVRAVSAWEVERLRCLVG
jgi:hypothetical protein